MPIDAETKEYLEEVKKGKPRRFAMIMKGEKIVSLIVYKKGTVEKYKKQAKADGAGRFYYGVVAGKGQNITFQLGRDDGFDSEPGKDIKLKAYLKAEAGLQFKPQYEIVTSLPPISDADDPDDASTQANVEGEAPASDAVDNDAQVSADPLASQLLDALGKMAPLMKQALAVAPEKKAEILGPPADIKQAIEAGQVAEAKQALLDYGTLLKGFASQPASSPEVSDRTASWQAAREKVVKQIKIVAQACADTKDPDARGAIIELNSIVKNLTPHPETPQQVAELERYLKTDDVITAAEEIPPHFGTLVIREPLLNALASL